MRFAYTEYLRSFHYMKRILLLAVAAIFAVLPSSSQNRRNDNPDSILGEYRVPDAKNGDCKVRFTRNAEGTYDCQVFWLEIPIDPATGKPWLDFRNPVKSKRNVRCDELFIIRGLKYDSAAKMWNGAKIYDPNRGISVSVKCRFASDGSLEVKGTVFGIGETMYWKKL